MNLHTLHPSPGSKTKKKRIGRGHGSGHGKTSGKGHKGLLARSGRGNMPGFEGGQMPLARRLPKRGFVNIFKIEYTIINIQTLAALEEISDFTPSILREIGLVKGRNARVKILGEGDIIRPISVEAHKFSEVAKQKIEGAGGKAKVMLSA